MHKKARAKLMFCPSKPVAFFAVLVAVAVAVAVAVIVAFKPKKAPMTFFHFLLTAHTTPRCFGKSAKYEASTSHNCQGWTFFVAF